jgi:hypothetical protein
MSIKIGQPIRQACLALISDEDSLLFADGYDDAILGVAEFNGAASVVYDTAKVLEILCDRDGMTRAEAEEFFAYNVAGAFMGESSPIFLQKIRPEQRQRSSIG